MNVVTGRGDPVSFVNAPPAVSARYTAYPLRFDEVLAFQVRITLCGIGVSTAVLRKFKPLMDASLIVTVAVDGLNVYPDWLAATM